MKKYNFSAGPCVLPQEVLKKASESVLELNDSGLSLIEVSHRSKEFVKIMNEAQDLVRELLNVPEGYSILFLQGGASLQFTMVPYNFLKKGGTAAYINTGRWSEKAMKEAKRFGKVKMVASSKEQNFKSIPKEYIISENADYVHFTSNNTIFGTQFKIFPKTNKPLICDMSSDIFSRKINVSDFALIYAGAQKNLGPAGTTLIIVKDELLGQTGRDIPSYLNYQVHIANNSMFNTPPVFSIATSRLMLKWLKVQGGVDAIEKVNKEKANALYEEIDRNPLFEGVADKQSRSMMNVTFVLKEPKYSEHFETLYKNTGIANISGYRLVGGYRASIYNGMPREGIEALITVMKQLEEKCSLLK